MLKIWYNDNAYIKQNKTTIIEGNLIQLKYLVFKIYFSINRLTEIVVSIFIIYSIYHSISLNLPVSSSHDKHNNSNAAALTSTRVW